VKISDDLAKAYNDQIRIEYESMYAYEQMSAYFHNRNLTGFAAWMRVQAREEHSHALKFTDFLLDRGGVVTLQAIAAPSESLTTPLSVFEAALRHEEHVSAAIGRLYSMATDTRDFASYPLLQWFVNEQIEEESMVGLIVERLRMAGDDPSSLLILDRELGSRGDAPAEAGS
jgi:ferritin